MNVEEIKVKWGTECAYGTEDIWGTELTMKIRSE